MAPATRSRRLVRHNDCLHRPPCCVRWVVIFRIPLHTNENIAAKLDGPMTFGYGIDAIDAAHKNQRGGTNICFSRRKGALVDGEC